LVVALGGNVQLELAVQWKIVDRIDPQIQRILTAHGITGGILQLGITEDTQAGQGGLRPFLRPLVVKFPRLEI